MERRGYWNLLNYILLLLSLRFGYSLTDLYHIGRDQPIETLRQSRTEELCLSKSRGPRCGADAGECGVSMENRKVVSSLIESVHLDQAGGL